MSEVADLLDAAADLIRKEGWWQQTPPDYGGHCVMTAISLSSEDTDHEYLTQFVRACEVLAAHVGVDPADLAHWNDDPSRTEADVLLAFKKAAYEARM